MTIPLENWCSTCEEEVNDHSTICTTCGETLGLPPASTTTVNRRSQHEPSSFSGIRAIPEFLNQDVHQADQDVQALLLGLRGQVSDINLIAQQAMAAGNTGEEWQEIPAELLAPQNAGHRGRPTSKVTLSQIPRVVLHDKSSLFRQASFTYANTQCATIPAEFGPGEAIQLEKASIIIASPLTALKGLSKECKDLILTATNPIVYLERGDGVTFVNKAIQAQNAGASAVVIGNNQSAPWPYIMKDSAGEAQKMGLDIPVVMIKQTDGIDLVKYCRQKAVLEATLKIQALSKDCVVCCETYNVEDTVMTLPTCGHVFHERCALAWLTKHNTCPFCRRELPTDDTDYEQERRRTQRTHAGSVSGNNEEQWNEYYG